MKRYTVRMRRHEQAYRTIEVAADNPRAAHRRALAIARDELEPRDGEEAGEWCDNMIGRTVVMSVEESK